VQFFDNNVYPFRMDMVQEQRAHHVVNAADFLHRGKALHLEQELCMTKMMFITTMSAQNARPVNVNSSPYQQPLASSKVHQDISHSILEYTSWLHFISLAFRLVFIAFYLLYRSMSS
jgi:hypothetical protein